MSITARCVHRPVAVAMMVVAVTGAGLMSALRLPIDLLPDLAYPQLVVYTSYPAAGPVDVQRTVTEPIERAVARVPGVERVESVSREGASLVTLRLAWGSDLDFAALATREQLDRMPALPHLAGRPVVLRTDPAADPILSISIAGPDPGTLRDLAEAVLERRLEQIEGIAQAVVTGGAEREIHVDVDARALEARGLEISDVASALAAANASAVGGTIRRGAYRYVLRTTADLERVAQIGEVAVTSRDAAMRVPESRSRPPGITRVRDLATVTDGWKERDAIARYNGSDAVALLLYKEAGANTVRVAARVERVLAQLRKEYPDTRLDVVSSQARFISDSISDLVQALLLGGVLAFLVLFLFLKDLRYAVGVALAIPVSALATLALMEASGVSLNMMSLGGLALGVGMLVDNSIVVLENVSRHRGRSTEADGAAAAVVATEEVQSAVTASTLTTIAVFIPVVYVDGVAGELFRDLSLAVVFSLIASLMVALTLLPTLAARWGDGRVALPLLEHRTAPFSRLLEGYHRTLLQSLDHPARVLAAAMAALALALLIGARLPRSALPTVDYGSFTMRLQLPLGTPIERTSRVAADLERVLLADEDVEAVFTQVGRQQTPGSIEGRRSDSSTGTLEVRLDDGVSTEEVLHRIASAAGRAAGEGSLEFATDDAGPLRALFGDDRAALSVGVRGDDLDESLRYAQALRAALEASPALSNVRLGLELGQPEMRLRVDRAAIARYGLDVATVADAVETSIQGRLATQLLDFDRRVPVIVRLPDEDRRALRTLDHVRVQGVQLRQLVRVHATSGPSELRRSDQAAVVPVLANVGQGTLLTALDAVAAAVARTRPPAGVRVELRGQNEETRRSFRSLAFAMGIALLLVYMIMAAQFESLLQPLIVMVAVPLAAIGALLALWLSGSGLDSISLVGIVILIGVVVNDAIVKVSFINQARACGTALRPAILAAGRARLRPILMTTVTTVCGLLPLALGVGGGAALRAPLAIAVIGGLTTSTLLTLIVVPVVYERVERLRGTPTEAASGSYPGSS